MKLIELCPKTKQNKTEVKKQQTNKKKSTNQIRTPTPTNQLTNQSQKQKNKSQNQTKQKKTLQGYHSNRRQRTWHGQHLLCPQRHFLSEVK